MNIFRFLTTATVAALVGCGGGDGGDTADTTSVGTTEGVIVGTSANGVVQFLGVPYAQPPLSQLRWRPPQKPAIRSSPLQATAYGNACAQAPIPGVAPTPSEDCLYLNVWKPSDARPGAKLPVLVYIHGGAFILGSGVGDNGPLARRGMVVVSFNYRLGMLGYLANRSVKASSGDASLGNYALMDMMAALEWVQRNADAFGGDPANVTIWGTSAGATQGFALLQSPKAKGLFHRALLQSGGGAEVSHQSTEVSLGISDAAVAKVGCVGVADEAACLRNVPVTALLGQSASRWRPTVDGQVLTQVPARAFESGNFNKVPVMIGGVFDEGTIFSDPAMSAQVYPFALRSLAPGGFDTSAIESTYALSKFPVPGQAFARAQADATYSCGNSARRDALSAWVPVYGWEMTDPTLSSTANRTKFYYGTAHGMDSYYFSDTVEALPTYPFFDAASLAQEPDALAKRKALGAQMSAYLANFVKSGNPNAGNVSTTWPAFTGPTNRAIINFTLPLIKTSVNEFEKEHYCDTLWGPSVFPKMY